MDKRPIKHTATVSRISNGNIEATISVSTACDGCHAKSSCGSADGKTRTIDIPYEGNDLQVGDTINILGDAAMGNSAVTFAYIVPFILVMLTLIVSLNIFHLSEISAGGYSLLILPLYYIVLYMLKDKFKKKYTFRIN